MEGPFSPSACNRSMQNYGALRPTASISSSRLLDPCLSRLSSNRDIHVPRCQPGFFASSRPSCSSIEPQSLRKYISAPCNGGCSSLSCSRPKLFGSRLMLSSTAHEVTTRLNQCKYVGKYIGTRSVRDATLLSPTASNKIPLRLHLVSVTYSP